MMRTLIRAVYALFIALFLALFALTIYSQTDYFKTILKGAIERAVYTSTGQRLTIGKLEGNFVTGLRASDVRLEVDGEPFVDISSVEIAYSMLLLVDKSLFMNRIVPLDAVRVENITLTLVRDEHGRWNYKKLRKKRYLPTPKKGRPSGLKWSFLIERGSLEGARLVVVDKKRGTRKRYAVGETEFSLYLLGPTRTVEINIGRATSLTVEPGNLTAQSLEARVTLRRGEIGIDVLKFNALGMTGYITGRMQPKAEGTGRGGASFAFGGFLYGVPTGVGHLNLRLDKVTGSLAPGGTPHVKADITVLPSRILEQVMEARLEGLGLEGATLSLPPTTIKSRRGKAVLEATVDLSRYLGRGDKNTLSATLTLTDYDVSFLGNRLKGLADGTVEAARLLVDLNWGKRHEFEASYTVEALSFSGPAGRVNLSGSGDLVGGEAGFDLTADVTDLDPSVLSGKKNVRGSLNGEIKVTGSLPLGKSLSPPYVFATGLIKESDLMGGRIRQALFQVSYSDHRLKIISLNADLDGAKVAAMERDGKLNYSIQAYDLSLLGGILPGHSLAGSAEAVGYLSGDLPRPEVAFTVKLQDASLDGYAVGSGKISGTVETAEPASASSLAGSLEKVRIGNKGFEQIDFTVTTSGGDAVGRLRASKDDDSGLETRFTIYGVKESRKRLVLDELAVTFEGRTLRNSAPLEVLFSPGKVKLPYFHMVYGDSFLLARGEVDLHGPVDLAVEVKEVDLREIASALVVVEAPPVEGMASGTLRITGTFERPNVALTLKFDHFKAMDLTARQATATFGYKHDKYDFELVLNSETEEILNVSVEGRLKASLSNIGRNLMDAPLRAVVRSNGINLSPLAAVNSEIVSVDGAGSVDLRIEGTLAEPRLYGTIVLDALTVGLRSLRNPILIEGGTARFDGQHGALTGVNIVSNGHRSPLTGKIDLANGSFEFECTLNRLELKPRGVKAKVDGTLKLKGERGKIAVSGKLKIRRARIKLPELPTKQIEDIKFVDEEEARSEEFRIYDRPEDDYYKDNFAIDLEIKIPGNTWIKGRGTNVEVKGFVRLHKAYGERLRIMGDEINIVRGTYDLLGKLFILEKGTISFRGEPDINPFIDITALYKVSDVKIYASITGTMKKPSVTLSSEPSMEQTEIFSYLAFGTSSNSLTPNARASLQGKVAEVVSLMAAGKIKDLIGEQFGLDVISITGGEKEFSGTQVEVGKYLTDNLYVAYERSSVLSPYTNQMYLENTVKIELTLFDYLKLESTVGGIESGGDVFFNINY